MSKKVFFIFELVRKKSFFIIMGLSVVVTYVVAFADFAFNITTGSIGLPFGFSSFNLLGASTDQTALIIDIVFWFIVIWVIWKVLQKIIVKK